MKRNSGRTPPEHLDRPQRGWTMWTFRLIATADASLLVAQPIIIGRVLSGESSMLPAHRMIGVVLVGAAGVLVAASLLQWRLGHGPAWPIAVAIALMFGTGTQLEAGLGRQLALHIPLGVALVGAGCILAVWAWLPARRFDPRTGRERFPTVGSR